MGQTDTEGGTHWTERLTNNISSRAEISKLDRVWQYLHTCIMAYFQITFQIPSIHIPDMSEAFQTPYITFQIPYRHPSDLYIAL